MANTASVQAKQKKSLKQIWSMMSDTNKLLSITIIAFFLMFIGALIFENDSFSNPQVFCNFLNTNGGLIITACGMSLVMIIGGIDISVGGVVGLVTMSCAVYLDYANGNIATSILLALGIGLAFGIVQGALVAFLDIQPFIVTLAGMFFARGLTTIIHSEPFNVANETFVALKDTRIDLPFGVVRGGNFIHSYIEIGVVVALLVVLIMFFVLQFTKLGRHFYAIGGNAQSALMLGINVKLTRFIAYVICGFLSGLGGYVYFLHVGSGSPSNASGMEMNAIASSIIGGTMLTGGVGNIFGTLFGVLSLETIKNIVTSAGLHDAWWTGITIAAMLCIFLVIQSLVVSNSKSGSTKASIFAKLFKKNAKEKS